MSKIERLAAAFIATSAMSIALVVTMLQWRTGFAAGRAGPVDIGESGFLIAVCATLTVIAAMTWRREGRPHALWTPAALLSWGWIIFDLADLDGALGRAFDAADIQPVIAWAVVALGSAATLFNRSHPTSARLLLCGGLLVQGAAFAADLRQGTVFAEPNVQADLSNFYLALYFAGFMMIAAWLPVSRGARTVPLLGRLLDFAPAKHVSILWRDIGWRLWRLRHPGGSYADFYVATVNRQLAMGIAHRTLGRYHFSFDVFTGQSRNRAMKFGDEGQNAFNDIRALGVTPDSTIADFGCGTLRVGQHFIGYLGTGRYWGLDVTDRFYQDGLALLPQDLVRTKAPNLRVISPESLAECRAAKPDIVFSIHVLMHVPEDEVDGYWRNLAGLMHTGSRAFVTCYVAEEPMRTAAVNWAYPADMLSAAIARAAPGRPVTITVTGREKSLGGKAFRSAVIVVGPAAA